MMRSALILYVMILLDSVENSHFRGGAISWRPTTNQSSVLNTTRKIFIDQRYAWSRTATGSSCTSVTITGFGLIGEASVSAVKCQSPATTCTNVGYTTNISTQVPCTDYNSPLGMSFGHSHTQVNLTVQSSGVVLGYVVSGAWLTLQLGGGGWSLMTYINMQARSDNGLINSSPATDIQPVVYVPAGINDTTSIDIPMYDDDGDELECRFAKSSGSLGGVTINECSGVCAPVALPASTQLISGNNTCTLIVNLTSPGYYAVAIQIEDFLGNPLALLSSVPVQFLLFAYDASNPTSNCELIPIITSIPPDLPSPGSTITVQVTVPYTAMVIARTGCNNDMETSISNFITSSPPGMLKSILPFAVASGSYAINLNWTPTIDQLGQTYKFCATAIDSNYHASDQYCFYLLVGPRTTTTTTTSTTSTTTTSTSTTSSTSSTSTSSTSTTSVTSSTSTSTTSSTTTTTPYNCLPLVLGLGLGLGLPLLLLLSLMALSYLCRWFPSPLRSLLRYRYGRRRDMYCQHCQRSTLFDDPRHGNEVKCQTPEGTCRYREQYVKCINDQSTSQPERESFPLNQSILSDTKVSLSGFMSPTFTSFLSPSTNNLPTEDISRVSSPPQVQTRHHGSVLLQAYFRQVHPQ